MAIGFYGVRKPADTDPSDIEVIVLYTKTRNSTEVPVITKLLGSQVISPVMSTTDIGGAANEVLGGLYTLQLPKATFSNLGFYTIYIRPAQIRVKIEDCAELATFPDVKGLVFNKDSVPIDFISKFTNNGLDGYRIEYLNTDNSKIPNLYRIITSSFLSEPVTINMPNSSQKSIKYIYNNSGNLLFCTVTPNAAPSYKPTSAPFIGKKGQSVIITNTNFTPEIIELEMVNYDVNSLAVTLMGNQITSLDDGIYTVYDFDNNIYNQYDLYEIRDALGNPLYEVKRKRTDIDTSKAFNNIVK